MVHSSIGFQQIRKDQQFEAELNKAQIPLGFLCQAWLSAFFDRRSCNLEAGCPSRYNPPALVDACPE